MRFKQLKNETFDNYHRRMISWGIKNQKVFPYPTELFDALRPFCVGGFPASIMLFCNELCNGKCYDRSQIMQLAFDNCQVIHADIESLRIIDNGRNAEHSFVETDAFGENRMWVVDTSVGLIFDKNFYYSLEKPKVNRIFSKAQCMDNIRIKEVLASDFEKDKYILPMTLPFIEQAIKSSMHIGTLLYKDLILSEIDSFKQAIDYDGIVAEIDTDIQLLKEGRGDELDKKFGIVRDNYGREISRNGVPNPYYKSFTQLQEDQAYFESIKGNPEKLCEYFATARQETDQIIQQEESTTSAIAKQRLEEINQNPTANFYDKCSTHQSPTSPIVNQVPAEQ